jgi:hypothetical protein
MLHEISAHYTTSRLSGEPTSAREYQPVELVVQLKSNSDLSCRLILRLPAFVLPLAISPSYSVALSIGLTSGKHGAFGRDALARAR